MKNQKILILTGALLLAGLVACKPNNSSSEVPPSSSEPTSQAPSSVVEEKEMTVEEAEAIIAKFDTSLTGTVKATYHPDYQMNVDSDNASMKAFQEDVDKVITIEADFTAGDLYLHTVVGTGESAKSLSLVYEGSDGYYYVESTMADPLKLANEEAALAKINELITKATKTKAGWVNPETFLYTGGLAYEHKQFLLDSTNVELEFMDETRSFEVNEKGGLDIALPLEYVGYTTDSGISELSPKEGSTDKAGARISISTDENGRVVSFAENYEEAELEMPLTTPPPVISLHGSHTFAAEYGATLTKKDTIPHEATFGTITYSAVDASKKGYVEVYSCAPYAFTAMTPVTPTTEVPVGHWLCVKPVAAEGNGVAYVTYANSSTPLTDPAQANGYYCFEVKSGANSLAVTFSGSNAFADTVNATATTEETGITVSGPVGFTLAGQAPSAWDYVAADGFAWGADKWIAIEVKNVPADKEAVVKVNDKNATLIAGYYCVNAKLPTNYAFTVTLKDKEATHAPVTVNKDAGVESVELGSMVPPAYNDITPITNEVEIGKWLTVSVECKDGYEIDKVTVGGTELQTYGSPYYCHNVKAAGAIEVVITTKSTTPSGSVTPASATLEAVEATNGSYQVFTCAPYAFTAMTPVTDGAELVPGNWLCVMPTAATGYEVANVAHNGSTKVLAPLNVTSGYYCYTVAEGENKVQLFTRTEGATNLVSFAGCENAKVEIVTCPAGSFDSLSSVVDGCELQSGNWICIKVTPADGYAVSSVTLNGSSQILGGNIQNTGGYYCYNVATGTNTIVVTVSAAA